MDENNLAVGFSSASSSDPAILGMNFLARYQLILDVPHQLLTLTRSPHYQQHARLDGWTGAALEQKGRILVVKMVAFPSPAARAGLKPGDELVALDGKTVRSLGQIMAQELLNGQARTPVTVTLRRKGKPLPPLTLTRASEFDEPPPCGMG